MRQVRRGPQEGTRLPRLASLVCPGCCCIAPKLLSHARTTTQRLRGRHGRRRGRRHPPRPSCSPSAPPALRGLQADRRSLAARKGIGGSGRSGRGELRLDHVEPLLVRRVESSDRIDV
eukprot:2784778-Prymnesium_polylepis.1